VKPQGPRKPLFGLSRGGQKKWDTRGETRQKRKGAREHQVNCLTQRVENKGRRGGSEGSPPPPTCVALIETGAGVYWERKG
jgi:hypothetical protein